MGAPAPKVDLRRGCFLTQIGAAADRDGQLDLKIVRGLLRGLSALHNTATAGPPVEKYQATAKPNARRMECDCEGASEMVDDGGFGVRWLLMSVAGLEARVNWPWHGVARRASGKIYARTRNRTMARDSLPLKSCVFERVSRRYEVAEAEVEPILSIFSLSKRSKYANSFG